MIQTESLLPSTSKLGVLTRDIYVPYRPGPVQTAKTHWGDNKRNSFSRVTGTPSDSADTTWAVQNTECSVQDSLPKSPLLSICKQHSSAFICEQAVPATHCALLCPQPSAPAAQGSGCSCNYCCYYALLQPALLPAGLETQPRRGEACLLVLIGEHWLDRDIWGAAVCHSPRIGCWL